MRISRATRTMLVASATAIALASVGTAMAVVAGGGKDAAKNDDCLIVLDGVDAVDVTVQGKKNVVTCQDCDPSCDLDGVASANGTCTFNLGVNLNEPGIGTCEPAVLKTAKVSKKAVKSGIAVPAPVLDASAVVGTTGDVVVPTKKKGKKAGKLKVVLSAKSAEKPKRKDKDIFLFVCEPRPAEESCSGGTTTTTIDTTTTTTTLPLDECGDGERTGAEECDDGNPDPTDGCTNDCTICGNGTTTAPEECDNGPGTCSAGNVSASCVNDVECDSAPDAGDGVCALANDGGTCSPNCRVPGCGDGLVTAPETCDDGNTEDGDDCPANCIAEACTPNTGTDLTATVSFAGSSDVASLQVFVDYPEGKVLIPGAADQIPFGIIDGFPNAFASTLSNDLDYALRQAYVDTFATAPGQLFQIHFETCSGQPAPTEEEFTCAVEAAGDVDSVEIQGVTCTVTLAP